MDTRLQAPEGRRWFYTALALGTLACAGGLAVFVEVFFAMPIPLAAYGGLAGIAFVIVLPTGLAGHRRTTIAAVVAFLLGLATLYLVDWTTRKPFLRDLDRVEVGMTRAEVHEVMGRWSTGTGWRIPRAPPPKVTAEGEDPPDMSEYGDPETWPEVTLKSAEVYRHCTTGARFNSDWGVVRYRLGRVYETEFMPD